MSLSDLLPSVSSLPGPSRDSSSVVLERARRVPGAAGALVRSWAFVQVSPRLVARGVSLAVGMAAVAAGVAAMLEAGLGMGPADALIGGVASLSGLAHGVVSTLFTATFLTLAVALRTRVRAGTFLPVVAFAPLLAVFSALVPDVEVLAARVVFAALGLVLICAGVGAIVASDLGAGGVELVSGRVAGRLGRAQSLVRMALELSFVATGAALGGPVGPATVVVAVAVGPGIALAARWAALVLALPAPRRTGLRFSRLR